MTAGTRLRPDPAAFFVVIDLSERIDPTPSVAGDGLLVGTKNFEFVVIEEFHLL
jgi:hypothetical protein